ncbi:hypothetical protein BJY21_001870 [Kineosphaera limosa]|nr:helix-turn-helix transcriptional regulator [Kineosphaera limosa]NYE00686.1 hypothetical protein [Kineosphaera limosa]
MAFRNVDADPSDPVGTWPYEGLVSAMERGSIRDWRRIAAELRAHPWGRTARHLEEHLTYADPPGSGPLLSRALESARREQEAQERAEVASRIDELVRASGLRAAEFAARIGTSASRLSTYRTGKVVPSATLLLRMERAAAAARGLGPPDP